jgi:hypothetical protein
MKYWLKRVTNCSLRRDCLECDDHAKCLDEYLESLDKKGEVMDGITPFSS